MRVTPLTTVDRIERVTGLSTLKDSDYTGPNRCWPCTGTNLAIAALLAVGVGAGATVWLPDLVLPATGAVALVSLAAIYLRGYLVPGTPAFTRRYFPDWLLDAFGKPSTPAPTDIDPRALLLEIGVLEDDPRADDATLDPTFAAAWDERIDAHAADSAVVRRTIADLAGVADDEDVEFETFPGMLVAYHGPDRLASWESWPACVADAAAAETLPAFDPAWESRPLAVRAELLGALRLFVEECPDCGGTVSLRTEVVESCCSSRDVVAASCDSCSVRLFEIDAPPELRSA